MISSMSILLCLLAVMMLVPAAFDYGVGNPDWQVFVVSALIVFFAGAIGYVASRKSDENPSRREIFIFVSVIWLLYCAAATLPFMLSNLRLSFTDAFFETASGFTTTGSTVLSGLDSMPPGILLWRSLIQWVGGLGIVVLGMTFLPYMRSGGQQLFALEQSDKTDKPFPQARQFAERIVLVYLAITVACMLSYIVFGMTPFEALNHSMTTVSTGGYSTSDGSMGHFANTGMLAASTFFMFIGGVPFFFLIRLTNGKFDRDIQIEYFLYTIGIGSLAIAIYRAWNGTEITLYNAVSIVFNVTSVLTTTGYASEDYLKWGVPVAMIIFFLTFIGACSGSTAGGYKQFRMVISASIIRETLLKTFRPNQVMSLKYGDRPITPRVAGSVMYFSVLYAATFFICALIYTLFGLDFTTSMSASITALANVGPGLGEIIGPSGNFSSLPDLVKWMLSFEMIIGRLEIMSVYVFLTPAFWRD